MAVGRHDFVARLHAVGEERYHDKHPFHQRLVAGSLSREQVQAWAANRYYYQKQIPVKDAAILANLPSAQHRRVWIERIYDHDGREGTRGGTQAWIALARATGLEEADVVSERYVAAGTRFAVDAYVHFARTRSWVEAVASSLTELFGPPVMVRRMAAIVERYPWIDPAGLAYFETRIPLAKRDAETALQWIVAEATTPELQDRCVAALRFKCDVLWGVLDATALSSGVFVPA
ncbi:MAG: pyrroloquinoline-quinone synthase PqqC [Candidatus Eremiobacteraeota bacterium]|nr:pyrroloquinoline-quinone synthase PqqC [Candidatus Eremiobacteraeota bacterium]